MLTITFRLPHILDHSAQHITYTGLSYRLMSSTLTKTQTALPSLRLIGWQENPNGPIQQPDLETKTNSAACIDGESPHAG